MSKIKKNDIVQVIAGKDKGKTGKVLAILRAKNRAIVEKVNFIKKHVKKTKDDQKGGIVEKEASINLTNLSLFCKGCNRPTKIGIDKLKDGTKVRFCKKCKEVF
ncbi:MAG: 50S ribosomal protein L24 [Candidatus Omnitrophota bacterium]